MMLDFIRELFPIARSISGPGLRETLRRIAAQIPIVIHEVPTGTPAFDWSVPREWWLGRATLRGPGGKLLADTVQTNLNVLNYSEPFRGALSLEELQPHLHSMPEKPGWVPYRTSYYKPEWGICLQDQVRQSLPSGTYEVDIDTAIYDGSLSYGELVIPGKSEQEMLFSTHCCHPSLANDNLSGIAVAVELARRIASDPRRRLTARFLFLPGTIGSITWLSRNVETTRHIAAGLVLSCLGDRGPFTYKRSRQGHSEIDKFFESVIPHSRVRDFVPYGYDERQYCSPGFNLPVGCLMRTPNGEYPEYHTSADNVHFLDEAAMLEAVELAHRAYKCLHLMLLKPRKPVSDRPLGEGPRFRNLNPMCEPQLGRRGLYATMGGHASVADLQTALLWVLNYSDGLHGIDWIASRSKIDPKTVQQAAELLVKANLLAH